MSGSEDIGSDREGGEPTSPITWEFIAEVRKSWLETIKIRNTRIDAHKFIQALISDTEKDFESESDWLNRWVVLFDHIIFYHYLVYSCYQTDLSEKSPEIVRCLSSLQSSIFDDLYSIRLLISRGRELAARQLLRSLVEFFDLQILLYLDPSVSSRYFETQDAESANKFWHENISKGKLASRVQKYLQDGGDGLIYSVLSDITTTELKMLGQMIHPSYVTSLFTYVPPINLETSSGYIPLNYPHDGSVRTIKHIACLTLLSLFIMSEFPLSGSVGKGGLGFDARNGFHWTVRMAKVLTMNHLRRAVLDTNEFFETD